MIPQSPGDSPQASKERRDAQVRGEAPAQASQAPVPSSSRTFEVAPELLANKPPLPRNPNAPTSAAAAANAFTQATRYGDLVFVSGQIALDIHTNQFRGISAEEQTRTVMENIRVILESHKLTMANVVSTTVYLKDIGDYRAMNTVYETYFKTTLPARSVVEVSRLPRAAVVEIAVVAGR
jgi:2-iminobutanoate/2-iminopropanoate deaminase